MNSTVTACPLEVLINLEGFDFEPVIAVDGGDHQLDTIALLDSFF